VFIINACNTLKHAPSECSTKNVQHKCTKCKWTGQSYDADWHWPEDENEDAKHVCPYCESDIELTPEGVVKEEEKKKRMEEIDKMFEDEDLNEH
jgi:DNA-directed RNA polymerase subunit RPC12/RpoP